MALTAGSARTRGARASEQADARGQPQGLGGDPSGRGALARAVEARDLGGRPVGEEVEDRERAGEQRPGQGQRGELRRAQVPDDRRVHQDVQRLGRQRAQRGQRDAQDLAVVRGAAGHGRSIGSRSPHCQGATHA